MELRSVGSRQPQEASEEGVTKRTLKIRNDKITEMWAAPPPSVLAS